ncbi:response regulator transcription factor [Enhygromyxa salina]|uniref:Transcriptional regulatory protein BaeR n=1 Tax=Enhygromyxa salina TaxID=215803 RepID=A0A2S9Y2T1_9BACT|nr:response regulator transcription factor [Enhygromyxa salina]PRP99341.1 Transcriptional regulatory protein BaeR [Enhygromyxa salina]
MSALLRLGAQPMAAPARPPTAASANSPGILVVDDDPKLREVVGYALRREGYEVCEARHGGDALALLDERGFDLLVVDVSMPEVDGFEFVRRLRRRDDVTPVLFLSARSDEIDRILGLELGGDDYVTKPFSTRELVTRVKVILRRITRGRADTQDSGSRDDVDEAHVDESQLVVGQLRLSPETHRSWWGEHEVVLTATEFRLLEVLMGRPGRVYSRDELGELAYPDTRHVSGRTLDSHVRRIRAKFRAKLRAESGSPTLGNVDPVETVHGVGYRLRNHEPKV